MKICTNCHAQIEDGATFCFNCGTRVQQPVPTSPPVAPAAPTPPVTPPPAAPVRPQPNRYDPYDHTNEFDKEDIAENRLVAMISYLMGPIGLIIALLAKGDSKYIQFHVRQAMKYTIAQMLLLLCTTVLFWTILIPIVCTLAIVAVAVLQIISFIQVCCGQAKEPFLLRYLPFLK